LRGRIEPGVDTHVSARLFHARMTTENPPTSKPPQSRLKPARPMLVDESAGYMPRMPWRWILIGTMSLSTLVAVLWMKQDRKASALRSQLVQVHQKELEEPARRYGEFRQKIETLITEAAAAEPERYIDRRLRLSGLRSGQGLYLRLPADKAGSPEDIEAAASVSTPDAIAACLGLAPASASGLWDKGGFLKEDWLKQRQAESVMDLRVTDEMLANKIRADLPAVLHMLRADWFLLVLQHGQDRREHPVDVFLWDLRSSQKLLSARVQSRGLLLPVRIKSKDAPYQAPPSVERRTQGSANDCSIAAQLKQLAGASLLELENADSVTAVPQAAGRDGGVDGGRR